MDGYFRASVLLSNYFIEPLINLKWFLWRTQILKYNCRNYVTGLLRILVILRMNLFTCNGHLADCIYFQLLLLLDGLKIGAVEEAMYFYFCRFSIIVALFAFLTIQIVVFRCYTFVSILTLIMLKWDFISVIQNSRYFMLLTFLFKKKFFIHIYRHSKFVGGFLKKTTRKVTK